MSLRYACYSSFETDRDSCSPFSSVPAGNLIRFICRRFCIIRWSNFSSLWRQISFHIWKLNYKPTRMIRTCKIFTALWTALYNISQRLCLFRGWHLFRKRSISIITSVFSLRRIMRAWMSKMTFARQTFHPTLVVFQLGDFSLLKVLVCARRPSSNILMCL